jgi:hypothetical protein
MPGSRSSAALGVAALASVGALIRSPVDWPGVSLACLVVAFAALAVLVASERARPTLRRAPVLVLTGLLLCIAVVVPPRRSTDVWAYAMYGRLVAHHHVSPYTHSAADVPDDPVARRVAPVWKSSPSVYGPVFTALSAAGMAVAGTSALAARLYFQVLAALAVGAALVLIDRRTRDPMALAFLGVNPLTIVSVVNGSHNDALLGLAILVAALLAMDRKAAWAGVAIAVGALVKVSAVLPAVLLLVWVLLAQGLAAALTFGVAAAVLVGVGIAGAGGMDALAPVREASSRLTTGSVWHRPFRSLSPSGRPAVARRLSALATAAVVGLTALLGARRARLRSPVPLLIAGLLAFMLLGSYVAPWYVAWSLPLLALGWRSPLSWVAAGHAGLLLLVSRPGPLDEGSFFRPVYSQLTSAVIPIVEIVIVVVLVVLAVRDLRRAPEAASSAQLLDTQA